MMNTVLKRARILHGVRPIVAVLITVAVVLSPSAGCTAPAKHEPDIHISTRKEGLAQDPAILQTDPLKFLKQTYHRCESLDQYRLTFHRQERLGLFGKKLKPVEIIRAAFRKNPFSVKFEWDNPDADYFESVYVTGLNDNKLIVRERKGISIFPPQVRILDVMDPIRWGRARNPITDFGLARVTKRTILPFEDPALAGIITIQYRGLINMEDVGRSAHHLLIEHPPVPDYQYTRQDFYIDSKTLLPLGTDLWLTPGKLGARYRYLDVDTKAILTDHDFRLSKDDPFTQPAP